MIEIKQSTTKNLMVFMVDLADHVSGKTGLTLTITASKDGAAFASITPTVTERGSGWYNLALTASHTDTLGDLCLHITGTGADPTDLKLNVVANVEADTYSRIGAAGAGLAAIPWNANWDSEVQSECADALAAYAPATAAALATAQADLDILTGADGVVLATSQPNYAPATASALATHDGKLDVVIGYVDTEITTIITHLTDIKGTGFVKDTHSLPQCLTATGFSTHSAAAVWAVGTRSLTDKAGFTISGTKTTLDDLNDIVASDILTTALPESYATDGGTFTLTQALYMIWSALGEFAISGTTITCKKLDGTTTAMTFTMDDATTPTSRTRSG